MRMKLYLVSLLTLLIFSGAVSAQTTAFTYQGRLTDGAMAANGSYQMQFSLYSVVSGPGQIGTTITNSSVAVTNGVFTVNLDFSPATPFITGDNRWLEIAVRKATDPPGFTTLTPRQQITSSPFAIRTQSAGLADGLSNLCVLCVTDAQISGIAASKITGVVQINQGGTGSSTLNFVDLSTSQIVAGAKTFSSASNSFTGGGSGLTGLNPANISSGTATININGIAAKAAIATSGATPSVADLTLLLMNYGSSAAVTDLTGGIEGQCVVMVTFNTNATIADSGNFRLAENWTPQADDTLTVCRSNASGTPLWYERARSANTAVTFALTVSKSGAGTGTVSSSPAGIDCGSTCQASYDSGSVVTLTAVPSANSVFTGWSGACTGTGQCVVLMNAAKSVTATFALAQFSLTVTKTGTGGGTVTSSPAGINCGADCQESYTSGTVVALTATPDSNSAFAGWSGACTGTGGCNLTMDAAKTVTATFERTAFVLNVSRTGAGTVTSSPLAIFCGASCSAIFDSGTIVTLTATPDAGTSFASWGGACTGTNPSCAITMNAAKSVSATFTVITHQLTVTRSGVGSGSVTSNPGGIDCGANCQASYDHGTVVSLSASPSANSIFTGWTGACTGTGACTVTMSTARNVSATFALGLFSLTVTKTGTGGGTLTSNPAGINCGSDCQESYTSGTQVQLVASADANSTFDGWSGACAGTGACSVTVDAAKTVTATFTRRIFSLTVTRTGGGTVTSDPVGIYCGADCLENFNSGSIVTLTATPNPGSTFTGWSGACTGTGVCTVTMDGAKNVTATFNP